MSKKHLLRRIAAVFTAAAMSVSLLCTNVSAAKGAAVKLDSELSAAKELGFLTEAQTAKLKSAITEKESAEMASRAVKKFYGKTGSYLPDRVKQASGKTAATRFYLAETLFCADYEIKAKVEYQGYDKFISHINDTIEKMGYESFLYAYVPETVVPYLSEDKKTVENMDGTKIKDYGDIWTAGNFGSMTVDYILGIYDRVTGLPAMDITSDLKFLPKKAMTVEETARTLLRWYRGIEQPAKYVKFSKLGTYDKTIITDELLNKETTLPEASSKNVPAWRGWMSDKMGNAAHNVAGYQCADRYFREGDMEYYASMGINSLSVYVSPSWFQGNQFKKGYVNETRIKELDNVLALCMKYDIHLTIAAYFPTGYTNDPRVDQEDVDTTGEQLKKPGVAEELASFWGALAKRYKGIDNKYLAFKVINEIRLDTEADYTKYVGKSTTAIRNIDKDRLIILDVNAMTDYTGIELAKKCDAVVCYHHYEPHELCFLDGIDTSKGVKWPYTLQNDWFDNKKGTVIDAKASLDFATFPNRISLNEVKKKADEAGVSFIVGEYGPTGEISLFSKEDLRAFFKDMTKILYGEGWGGTVCAMPEGRPVVPYVKGMKVSKLDNSTDYCNETFAEIIKEVNGAPIVKTPNNVKAAKSAAGTAKISWKKVSGASGYEVLWSMSKDGAFSSAKTITKGSTTSMKFTGDKGGTYYFKVRAYKEVNGKKYYSPNSEIKSVKV